MFERALQTKLKKLFQVDNVRFSATSENVMEQGVLFIDVVDATTRFTPKKCHAKVLGSIFMYAPTTDLKFGFFEAALRAANPSDKKDIFFTAFDQTKEYQGDLVERRTDFVYLHTGAYDPDGGGSMTRALINGSAQEIEDAYSEETEEEEPIDDDPTDDEGA